MFIAKTDSGIKTLADLKGKHVSFGSQSSTSGHLMPRSFLLQAGIDPDKDFKRVAYSGAHDATIAAVVSGKVRAGGAEHLGVGQVRRRQEGRHRARCDVFFTTPPYYDYNWSVHADMPAALREKLHQALLDAGPGHARGQGDPASCNRATRFIPTPAENYKGIEAAGRSAGLL